MGFPQNPSPFLRSLGNPTPPQQQRSQPPHVEGSPARTQQVRGGERRHTVLPRLPPAADFRPPCAVSVRRPSLAPSALPGIEPLVPDRRRVQAGERRGVATRSPISAKVL